MTKTIVAFAVLLVMISSFRLYDAVVALHPVQPLTDIDWPFTICGTGSWTPTSVTLGSKPARSANDNITIVYVS